MYPGYIGQTRPYLVLHGCFHHSHHFFISTEVKPIQKEHRTSARMTRHTHRRTRVVNKSNKYRPKTVNIREIRKQTQQYRPKTVKLSDLTKKPCENSPSPERVIYVRSPFYEQMENGEKTVEARPNYPCFQDIQPGTLVEFRKNRHSDESFTARITSRRVHRDFVTMLRKETIKDCLPDHDPDDLQRAVNTYHSFRQDTYKFIAKKHGVLSFRFRNLEQTNTTAQTTHLHTVDVFPEYDRNSLCSMFEAAKKYYKLRKYGRL